MQNLLEIVSTSWPIYMLSAYVTLRPILQVYQKLNIAGQRRESDEGKVVSSNIWNGPTPLYDSDMKMLMW